MGAHSCLNTGGVLTAIPMEHNTNSTSQRPLEIIDDSGPTASVEQGLSTTQIMTRSCGQLKNDHLDSPTIASCSVPSKRKDPNAVDLSRAKHAQNSSNKSLANTVTPASIIPSPVIQGMPKWLVDVMEMFQSENLGDEWIKLLDEWLHFESEHQFAEITQVSPQGRPPPVKSWIDRHRLTSWRPTINNLKEYKEQFQTWWVRIQRKWRVTDGIINRESAEGSWDCLRLPGMNGWQSILVGLVVKCYVSCFPFRRCFV